MNSTKHTTTMNPCLVGWRIVATAENGYQETQALRMSQVCDRRFPKSALIEAFHVTEQSYRARGFTLDVEFISHVQDA